LCLLGTTVSAQREVRVKSNHLFGWEQDFRPGPRIAISFQGKPSIEFGIHAILRASPYPDHNEFHSAKAKDRTFTPDGWWNVGPGVEFPFGAGQFIAGPKLFTELNVGAFSTALNITFFTSRGTVDPRVTPEIGLALFGFFGIRYGYSWAPLGAKFETIGVNRLTIFLLLVKPRIHNMDY